MFDWFDKVFKRREYQTDTRTDMEKIADDMNKIIPFPEPKSVPPMPEVNPPKESKGITCYSIGLTDNNRVSIAIGYGTITMNATGVQQLIEQLELFKRQIEENDEAMS